MIRAVRYCALLAAGAAAPIWARPPAAVHDPGAMHAGGASLMSLAPLAAMIGLPPRQGDERQRRYLLGPELARLGPTPVERMGWRPTGFRIARGGAVLSMGMRFH